jgi:hypothetical protein
MKEVEIKRIKELKQGRIYIVSVDNATTEGIQKLHDELLALKTGNEFIILPEGIDLIGLKEFVKAKKLGKKRRWKRFFR